MFIVDYSAPSPPLLQFISQGGIQEQVLEFERGGTTSATVSLRLTTAMAPRVKVLAVFAREDGELVADLLELEVQCQLENQVCVLASSS